MNMTIFLKVERHSADGLVTVTYPIPRTDDEDLNLKAMGQARRRINTFIDGQASPMLVDPAPPANQKEPEEPPKEAQKAVNEAQKESKGSDRPKARGTARKASVKAERPPLARRPRGGAASLRKARVEKPEDLPPPPAEETVSKEAVQEWFGSFVQSVDERYAEETGALEGEAFDAFVAAKLNELGNTTLEELGKLGRTQFQTATVAIDGVLLL